MFSWQYELESEKKSLVDGSSEDLSFWASISPKHDLVQIHVKSLKMVLNLAFPPRSLSPGL